MKDDLREVVARALYKADCGSDPGDSRFEGKSAWMQYDEAADAAIAAARPVIEREATAAIVAYARGATGSAWSRDVLQFADAIERGEHLKRPGDTPTQFPVAPDWHEHFGPDGISLNKPLDT